MSSTVKLNNPKTMKFLAVHGIIGVIVTVILAYMIPSLGTLQLNAWTAIALILGSGIAAVVIAHLRANVLLEAFIAGATATGATAIFYMLFGQALGTLVGVVFAGNFLVALGTYYYKKGRV